MGEYSSEINKMTWSFSRVNSFTNCRYEWYLNYLLKDENGKRLYENEQNFYATYGKFIHNILEKILKKEITVENGYDYYNDNFDNEVLFDVKESTREKYFYLGLDYFSILDFDWLSDYEILGVEKKCEFKIEGFKFIGYIDLLIRHKETGDIIIIDHKSSEYPLTKKGKVKKKKIKDYENYKRQLYLYSQQIFNEYGVYPKKISWNYFKEQKWLSLDFIKEEFEDSKKWVIDVIKDIYEEEDFIPNLDFFYCHNLCGFRNSCDYKLMGGA